MTKPLTRKELSNVINSANMSQLRSAMNQIIDSPRTNPSTLEIVQRALRRTVVDEKLMIKVHSEFIDARKMITIQDSGVWNFRQVIMQFVKSTEGMASTEMIAAQLASNYEYLKFLINEDGVPKAVKSDISLMLRMHGFVNRVARRRTKECELNTTGRSWILQKDLYKKTVNELMRDTDLILSEAKEKWNSTHSKINSIEDMLI
jgi:hypothetical protein